MKLAVTGITGTFGRAFATRILREALCERLVGVSRDELKQSEMAAAHADAPALRLFLGDVRDERRMEEAFHHCEVVVHAAALKRVDSCSYNPAELTQTNVQGTLNVIRAAASAGVSRVLLISSDKACSPLNIYGSSKQMAEQIAVNMNTHVQPRGTRVSVLRYGNVLGSRGSVIPFWRRQIEAGDPLTMTDARMMRFVLTIDRAIDLALAAVKRMEGGEIFVPILPTAKLTDIATAVAGPKYPRRFTGLRAGGEKLQEALLTEEEPWRTVKAGDFLLVEPSVHAWRSGGWHGDRLDPATRYLSDGTFGWATVPQLKTLLREASV